MTALRIPPGRAGRLWLRDRLALAERGLSLLDRKRALLEPEYARHAARAETTAHEWTEACLRARTWQLRATMLDGDTSLDTATPPAATLTVHYATLAGVRYPADLDYVDCPPPQHVPSSITSNATPGAGSTTPVAGSATPRAGGAAPVAGSATLHAASAAHREALAAAARHAAAAAAARALERELTATRTRVRALRHHRIPALRSALAALELQLEDQERADRSRLHRRDG
ncbi:V-type ATP synthase subunit D [Nocardia seriolae]|uniref:V-type ATPase, D subunit n=1 Tax=Nocardia seriolae TaxID=37332 RepID=A0ABC9YYH7_9NOCA|nr:V-type ATP synthase subunit D [Nocardia seriolae]APA98430.1 hypothetical protein NS506_04382 [Nocardia seriolae]OJF80317.1 hypothetical protein NS14008_15285 [Nocardia seriolae]PSK29152.1 hypothetical protein C6575_22675 [Nocardia seriolae]QOW35734.1 hypothetical protein IMZ23_12950 [Nocardia seriolae]QUN16775.1 hypothetical protein KEC46_32005 [Nocardia seriolae]